MYTTKFPEHLVCNLQVISAFHIRFNQILNPFHISRDILHHFTSSDHLNWSIENSHMIRLDIFGCVRWLWNVSGGPTNGNCFASASRTAMGMVSALQANCTRKFYVQNNSLEITYITDGFVWQKFVLPGN